MKLEHGDAVESSEVEWIRINLPEYEHIWSTYIGHAGHGSPLKIVGFAVPSPQDMDRQSFYQGRAPFSAGLTKPPQRRIAIRPLAP